MEDRQEEAVEVLLHLLLLSLELLHKSPGPLEVLHQVTVPALLRLQLLPEIRTQARGL